MRSGKMSRDEIRRAMLMYAITDRHWLNGRTLAHDAEECLKGGATMLQIREKEMSSSELLKEALEIKPICARYNVPLAVDDDVDAAIRCGADCIHVGQEDMEAGNVRKLIGDDMVLGVSAQTVEQALLAEKRGADYLGVGAMFATATKGDAVAVSFDTLREICEAVSIPVVAIGGIDETNIMKLAGTHCDGVSIISAIFGQKDIMGATMKLRSLSEKMTAAVK
ncbi:MAG: thiamine phosphate synthase [Eubacteriaceae bacterium]|nr:thiamine phosphate synthase [Eubacteriaceae bacterium]